MKDIYHQTYLLILLYNPNQGMHSSPSHHLILICITLKYILIELGIINTNIKPAQPSLMSQG